MQVVIHLLGCPDVLSLNVQDKTTIAEIQKSVLEHFKIPIHEQGIMFNGAELLPRQSVGQCRLPNNADLYLFRKISSTAMEPTQPLLKLRIPDAPSVPSGSQSVNSDPLPKFQVKSCFEDDIRRVAFDGKDFNELKDKLAQLHGVKNAKNFILKYKDDEGDMISMTTDAELRYAVEFQMPGNLLKVSLVKKKEKEKVQSLNGLLPLSPATVPMMKLTPAPHGLKDGQAILLCISKDSLNIDNEKGCYLGITQDGKLGTKFPKDKPSHWIVEEVEGSICLSSAMNRNWHLRITDKGEVDHLGGKGKSARFIPEIHGRKMAFRSVANEGKKNTAGSKNWYLGVSPEGYILGQLSNGPLGQFLVEIV